jgi:hypothetical protein
MSLLRWLGRPSRLDELSDEIESHIEEKTDELVAQGMSRTDAERAARRAFGDVTRVKETAGDVWRLESFFGNVVSDTRHALRGLIQKPGYSVAVVLTLALGIGANAVVFALVNAVVLRPLPYPDPDRIISASQHKEEERDRGVMQDFSYDEWTKSAKTLESHAAYDDARRSEHARGFVAHHRPAGNAQVLLHLRRQAAAGPHIRQAKRCPVRRKS